MMEQLTSDGYEIDSYQYCVGVDLQSGELSPRIYEDFDDLADWGFDRIVTFDAEGFQISIHDRYGPVDEKPVYGVVAIVQCDGTVVENPCEKFGAKWRPRKKGGEADKSSWILVTVLYEK